MLVYFHGNCQSRGLAQMIAPVFPEWNIEFYEVFSDKIVTEIDRYKEVVRSSDIIITQSIHQGYRDREEFSLDWVRSNAKSTTPIVVFPSMYFDGQLIGCSGLIGPAYEMDYHDISVLRLVKDGWATDNIIQLMLSEDFYDEHFISSEISRAIIELRRREISDGIDVPFSPFLAEFARETQLFHTVNHPCRPSLAWMANKLLNHLSFHRQVPDAGQDHIWCPHLPCLPSVIRYFGNSYRARPAWVTEQAEHYHLKNECLSRATYISRAVAFLHAAPEGRIDACLSDHRAKAFLARFEAAMPGRPLDINDATAGVSQLPRFREKPMQLAEDTRLLMMRFESLGGSGHGCEFGLIQREFKAEPLGLLRWADLSSQFLTAALNNRLDGVGEIENTEVFQPEGDGWKEWWTRDKRYWMAMRTFVKVADVTFESMCLLLQKRQRFLQKKLIADLSQGDKIFVYKNMYYDLSDQELSLLHNAVQSYGRNVLLYVRHEDKLHPNGTVEITAPGLMIGYIDHFGHSPKNEPLGSATQSFLAICQRAAQLQDTGAPYGYENGRVTDGLDFVDIDHGIRLAREAISGNDPTSALRICEALRRRDPNHSGAYLIAAVLLRDLDRDVEAETLFAEGLRQCPNDISLYIGHASVPHRAGNLEEACARWELAHVRFPDHNGIRESYATMLENFSRHDEAKRIRNNR